MTDSTIKFFFFFLREWKMLEVVIACLVVLSIIGLEIGCSLCTYQGFLFHFGLFFLVK